MWTENVTWFSSEEGKKGRIQVGQLADLIVPDRDYFRCAEDEIADSTSLLTMVGGRVVYASGEFSRFDAGAPPPAMPDWSPVRVFGGYAARPGKVHASEPVACGCANACTIHGREHATVWSSDVPIADVKSFWGALGCSCWAF
jgi:hypothetical protein